MTDVPTSRLFPARRPSHAQTRHRRIQAFGVAVIGAVGAFGQPATAQDSPCCKTGATVVDASNLIPTTPTGADCGGICTAMHPGGGEWTMKCDLTNRGGTAAADAVAIHDPSGGSTLCTGSGAEYCAFGTDTSGTDFYCFWGPSNSGDDLTTVAVLGGPGGDRIFFWYTDGGDAYDMAPYSGYDATTYGNFIGAQGGRGGNDELQGSRSTVATYTDTLSGDGDDDKVCGLAGDDICNGNGGLDLVCGDDDDDTLSGGGDADTCCGYAGYNVLTGEGDNDKLNFGDRGTNDGGIGNDKCNATGSVNCETGLVGDECPT